MSSKASNLAVSVSRRRPSPPNFLVRPVKSMLKSFPKVKVSKAYFLNNPAPPAKVGSSCNILFISSIFLNCLDTKFVSLII